eukprot:scaffold10204_cov68-Phaeocystis_antarctica.AAC.4
MRTASVHEQQTAHPQDLRLPPASCQFTVGGDRAPPPARRSPAARRPPRGPQWGRGQPGCAAPAPGAMAAGAAGRRRASGARRAARWRRSLAGGAPGEVRGDKQIP